METIAEKASLEILTYNSLISLEGALVLLLYASLLTDLYLIVRGRYSSAEKGSSPQPRARLLIPGPRNMGHNSDSLCGEKKKITFRSLDTLWRQMQMATNQVRLINVKHHVITKVMMEARIEARERERERQHQKREKLLAAGVKAVACVKLKGARSATLKRTE